MKREQYRKHVPTKILWQMRIFIIVFVIMLGVVLYDVVTGIIGLGLAFIALLIGTVIGMVSSRMSHLSWDHDGQRIVSRYDFVGILILAGYISLSVFRTRIVGVFIHGPSVGAFSFALIGATMLGRIIGTRNSIQGILRDEGVIK